ncbi:MAG: OmpA family protein [Ignavibacteriaceae bacterium]|nr:OmpA family protein [Ignavibacteriaceae bacterium]
MADENGTPIIVKKIKKAGGHHGGAWKVAYADFVTAMMALFIVLWVLSQDDATKEAVSRYFKDPIGFSALGKNVFPGVAHINDPEGTADAERELEKDKLKNMGDKILAEMSNNPEFKEMKDQIEIEFVDEGMRIEIIDSAEDIFFEIGTATLKPSAQVLLRKMGDQFAILPNNIIVEGHTDARPFLSKGTAYSNFALSSDRANSARQALVSGQLMEAHIEEVRGYADRKLRDKTDPYSVVNRRISIIVKYSK